MQLPELNSVDSQMVMRDLYETEFRLFDHLAPHPKKPLASVAMHPQEDVNSGSSLEQVCTLYVKHRIYDSFHIDLFQFMDLPPDVIELLIGIAKEQTKQHNKVMTEVEKSMQMPG